MLQRSDEWRARNFKVDYEYLLICLADRLEICKSKGYLGLSLLLSPPQVQTDAYFAYAQDGEKFIQTTARNAYSANAFGNASVLEGMIMACLDNDNLAQVFATLHVGNLIEGWSPAVPDFYRARSLCAMVGELFRNKEQAYTDWRRGDRIVLGRHMASNADKQTSTYQHRMYTFLTHTLRQLVGFICSCGLENLSRYKRKLGIGTIEGATEDYAHIQTAAMRALGIKSDYDLRRNHPVGPSDRRGDAVLAADALLQRLFHINAQSKKKQHSSYSDDDDDDEVRYSSKANQKSKSGFDVAQELRSCMLAATMGDAYSSVSNVRDALTEKSHTDIHAATHGIYQDRHSFEDFYPRTKDSLSAEKIQEDLQIADPALLSALMSGAIATLYQALQAVVNCSKPEDIVDFVNDTGGDSFNSESVICSSSMLATFRVAIPRLPRYRQLVLFRLLHSLSIPTYVLHERSTPDPVTAEFYAMEKSPDVREFFFRKYAEATNSKRPPKPPRMRSEIEFERKVLMHTRLLSDTNIRVARNVAECILHASGAGKVIEMCYDCPKMRSEILSSPIFTTKQRLGLSKVFVQRATSDGGDEARTALHTLHTLVFPCSPGVDIAGVADQPLHTRFPGGNPQESHERVDETLYQSVYEREKNGYGWPGSHLEGPLGPSWAQGKEGSDLREWMEAVRTATRSFMSPFKADG